MRPITLKHHIINIRSIRKPLRFIWTHTVVGGTEMFLMDLPVNINDYTNGCSLYILCFVFRRWSAFYRSLLLKHTPRPYTAWWHRWSCPRSTWRLPTWRSSDSRTSYTKPSRCSVKCTTPTRWRYRTCRTMPWPIISNQCTILLICPRLSTMSDGNGADSGTSHTTRRFYCTINISGGRTIDFST